MATLVGVALTCRQPRRALHHPCRLRPSGSSKGVIERRMGRLMKEPWRLHLDADEVLQSREETLRRFGWVEPALPNSMETYEGILADSPPSTHRHRPWTDEGFIRPRRSGPRHSPLLARGIDRRHVAACTRSGPRRLAKLLNEAQGVVEVSAVRESLAEHCKPA